jgi:hypothetical protein
MALKKGKFRIAFFSLLDSIAEAESASSGRTASLDVISDCLEIKD